MKNSFWKKITSAFRTKSFRIGGYSVLSLVVVLAIAVMANVLVDTLPGSWTQLDMTDSKLYSLSAQTKNIVSSLEQDVTIYWIVQQGKEESMVETLLSRYEDLSDRIRIVKKDPDIYPTFAQQYTNGGVYNNSIVVESDLRSSYISANDFYEYDYSSYYMTGKYDVSFAGENALTSAISYVASEELPIIYTLTGHGEEDLSSSFQSAVEKENITMKELSLLTEDAVPEDAACILINAPKTDVAEEEKDLLLQYIQSGGSLVLITDPAEGNSRTNLDALMAEYGMQETEGVILETDRQYYAFGVPYYLLPELNYHTITSPLRENGYYVILPIAHGLTVDEEERESLTVTELLTTSSGAFSKTDGYNMISYDKESGDVDGPFALALFAEEGESKILWISSASLLQDQANMQVSGGNQDFFLNCLNEICRQENSISIRAKSVSNSYLTMDSSTIVRLTALMVFVIPAVVLAAGIIIWIRRKRR